MHEIAIAELSRKKDRDLALDQLREDILIQYQIFFANLLMEDDKISGAQPYDTPVLLFLLVIIHVECYSSNTI